MVHVEFYYLIRLSKMPTCPLQVINDDDDEAGCGGQCSASPDSGERHDGEDSDPQKEDAGQPAARSGYPRPIWLIL